MADLNELANEAAKGLLKASLVLRYACAAARPARRP